MDPIDPWSFVPIFSMCSIVNLLKINKKIHVNQYQMHGPPSSSVSMQGMISSSLWSK